MKTVLLTALSLSLSLGAPTLALAADPETAKKDTKKEPKKEAAKGSTAKTDTAKEGGGTNDAYKLRGQTGN